MPSNSQVSQISASKPRPGADRLRQRDQRLHAMKEMVAHLVHGFNNSLAPLAGYLTLLAEEIKPGSLGDQYIKKFENSLKKTQGLIDALVQATHPEKQFVPKPMDMMALLQRTIDAWLKTLPPDAPIAVNLDISPCMLALDEPLWIKTIQHLLSNAQFALSDGGSLTISLHQQTLSELQTAELGISEPEVCCLTFQETGCGMDEEILDRACEPFFTTRPQLRTSGLGLTLVHSVVQLHGGQITLESTPGNGSTVTIWLPIRGC